MKMTARMWIALFVLIIVLLGRRALHRSEPESSAQEALIQSAGAQTTVSDESPEVSAETHPGDGLRALATEAERNAAIGATASSTLDVEFRRLGLPYAGAVQDTVEVLGRGWTSLPFEEFLRIAADELRPDQLCLVRRVGGAAVTCLAREILEDGLQLVPEPAPVTIKLFPALELKQLVVHQMTAAPVDEMPTLVGKWIHGLEAPYTGAKIHVEGVCDLAQEMSPTGLHAGVEYSFVLDDQPGLIEGDRVSLDRFSATPPEEKRVRWNRISGLTVTVPGKTHGVVHLLAPGEDRSQIFFGYLLGGRLWRTFDRIQDGEYAVVAFGKDWTAGPSEPTLEVTAGRPGVKRVELEPRTVSVGVVTFLLDDAVVVRCDVYQLERSGEMTQIAGGMRPEVQSRIYWEGRTAHILNVEQPMELLFVNQMVGYLKTASIEPGKTVEVRLEVTNPNLQARALKEVQALLGQHQGVVTLQVSRRIEGKWDTYWLRLATHELQQNFELTERRMSTLAFGAGHYRIKGILGDGTVVMREFYVAAD